MKEWLMGPVIERKPTIVDSLGEFRRSTSQDLIRRPIHSFGIIEDAEKALRGYYAPVIAANPVFGEYKVTRALRSIAFSAAFFNGATFIMNYLAPELAAYNDTSGDKRPFNLNDYFNPLPELIDYNFQTPQCRQFVKEVGGILKEVNEVGILDPDENCIPLAEVTKELHTRYVNAQKAANKGNTTADMKIFLRSLAEDNAHAILHSLIGMGGLTLYHSEAMGTSRDAREIAAEAMMELPKLAGIASVGRTFASEKIRPLSPDGRAADVVAFETALLTGKPMPRSSTATYFVMRNGQVHSPYRSLEYDEWLEPGMCPASRPFNYNARTHELDKGNSHFFGEVYRSVGFEDPIYRPGGRYGSAEAGFSFGIIVGRYTIYPAFPKVYKI